MSASRLRDLIASCVGRHKDIDACSFPRVAVYRDRLGLTIRDTAGATWRVHVLRDPWSRPDDGGEAAERVER